MTGLARVLNDEIARVARRALRADVQSLRTLSAAHRKHIAALRRELMALKRECALLRRQRSATLASPSTASQAARRFRIDGFSAWRKRMAFSAQEVGMLLGITGQTILNWEHGTSKPSPAMVESIAQVRGRGKRVLQAELEAKREAARPSRKRTAGRKG